MPSNKTFVLLYWFTVCCTGSLAPAPTTDAQTEINISITTEDQET